MQTALFAADSGQCQSPLQTSVGFPSSCSLCLFACLFVWGLKHMCFVHTFSAIKRRMASLLRRWERPLGSLQQTGLLHNGWSLLCSTAKPAVNTMGGTKRRLKIQERKGKNERGGGGGGGHRRELWHESRPPKSWTQRQQISAQPRDATSHGCAEICLGSIPLSIQGLLRKFKGSYLFRALLFSFDWTNLREAFWVWVRSSWIAPLGLAKWGKQSLWETVTNDNIPDGFIVVHGLHFFQHWYKRHLQTLTFWALVTTRIVIKAFCRKTEPDPPPNSNNTIWQIVKNNPFILSLAHCWVKSVLLFQWTGPPWPHSTQVSGPC